MEKGFAEQSRASLEAARAEVLSVVEDKVAALDGALAESEKKVKDFSAYMARLEAREEQTQKERLASLAKTMDAFDADLRGKLSNAAKKGESLEDEVFARLSRAGFPRTRPPSRRASRRWRPGVSDYQGDIDYRVKSLEEANSDIDAMRASLNETMERMAAGVRAEMKSLGANLVAGLELGDRRSGHRRASSSAPAWPSWKRGSRR